MKRTLHIFLATLFIFCFSAQLVFALSWAPTNVTSVNAVASDADGSNLIAGTNSFIYTSSNGGLSWTSDSGFGISTVASDADGTNLIVAESFGDIFTSDDGGANWTERSPGGSTADRHWRTVASDADGSNLIAGFYHSAGAGGTLYTSDDAGVTWTERQPAGGGVVKWLSVDSDSDGSHLIAGIFEGRLYTSSNSGADWTERQPAGASNQTWTVASDADGSNLIAAGKDARLYTSSNGGANWTERQPAGASNQAWTSVSSDDDGSHLIAAVNNGRLYVSDDGGVSWDEETPLGSANVFWTSVTSDDDGSHFAVASQFNPVYISPDTFGPAISSTDPADEAIEVDFNATFTIVFDQDIATSTGDIVLYDASDDSVVETIDIAGPQISLSDTDTLVVDPSVTLELGTQYYFLIDAGAVEDLVGNAFVGISDETTWNFTSDAVPTSAGFTPEDDGTGVATTIGEFDLYFDQIVAPGTGNITLYKTSDDSVVEIFDVTDGDAVTFDSTSIYLFPTVTLDFETDYHFLVDATAIEDENGNAFAGISDPTTWNFTTKAQPAVILDDAFITGDGFSDSVRALALDADEKILVGGFFNAYNGDDAFYIARLNTDGTLDETFVTGDGFDNTVSALTLDADGKVLVGGSFNAYNGDDAFYIARLNTDGTLDETFVTGDGFNSSVRALAVDADGKILVGGDFSAYDGDDTFRIARLNTDGTLDETFVTGGGFNASVYTLALDADGKILVGGAFDAYDGDDANHIARLNTDGTLDNTFVSGDGFDGSVYTLALDADEKILVGGAFNAYDGDETNYIARLNTDATLDNTFVSGDGFDDSVRALALDADEKILVGGGFSTYDGDDAFYIARLNTDGTFDEAFVTADGFDNTVFVFALDADEKILVGGGFSTYDGDDAYYIARLIPPLEEDEDEEEEPEEEEENDGGGRSGSSGGHRSSSAPISTGSTPNNDALTLLRTLITQYIAQGGTPTPTMLAFLGTPNTYTRNLTLGDTGNDVLNLQNFLIQHNTGPKAQALASNGATGYFGPLTQQALAEYQASVGITPAVGFFGPVTRAWVNGL